MSKKDWKNSDQELSRNNFLAIVNKTKKESVEASIYQNVSV